MTGRGSPIGAGALALIALAGTGCLAVYLPDQDLTAATDLSGGVRARLLEIRAEPYLRASLAMDAPAGTRLRAVTVSTRAGHCDGAVAVFQTAEGLPVPLPAPVAGSRRLDIYLPEPARLAAGPAWLALALETDPSRGSRPACVTVPLVAPAITWQRQRAWGSGGFVRGQNATHAAAGSGLLLMLGGWWRQSGPSRLGWTAELAFTAGWCGDFIACEEARVLGATPALAGQLHLVRTRRWLVEAELAGELTTALSTGTSSIWLMATPRATVRMWRTGPRLLGFAPDLRLGALGLELSYGHRFAWADDKAGQAPVIGLGLVVQPAL